MKTRNRYYRAILPLIFMSVSLLLSFDRPSYFKLEIRNKGSVDLYDHIFRLEDEQLLVFLDMIKPAAIDVSYKKPLPFQLISDATGYSAMLVQADLPAGESMKITIRPGKISYIKPQTYAELSIKEGGQWTDRKYSGGVFKNITELRVPDQLTDHSYYIRYEGPGWESDRVGYRFYLDWRNAVDVYGKKVDSMVLAAVGQDGYDSYHEMSLWGMDILKVGETLGIGTPAWWNGKKAERIAQTDSVFSLVACNGPLESGISTKYYGWSTEEFKTDVNWDLSIQAGSRLTRSELHFGEQLSAFCTGMVRMPGTESFRSTEGEWGYFATYGKQSLAGDLLGLVIFFRNAELREITTDSKSEVVILDPAGTSICYYFGAAWEQEAGGIKDREAFLDYIRMQQEILNESQNIELINR